MNKTLLYCILLVSSIKAFSQLGNLNLEFGRFTEIYTELDSSECFQIKIIGPADSIQEVSCQDYYTRTFEGLPIGFYVIKWSTYPDSSAFHQTLRAEITNGNITYVRLNKAPIYEAPITPANPCDDPPEEQVLDISLYDNHWYKQEGIRSGQQVSYSFSAPTALTPHLLFIYRSGLEFSHYRLEGDSAEVRNQIIAVQSKNFNYLNFKMDLALRLLSKKVSVNKVDRAIKLEGGITYRLPLLFKSNEVVSPSERLQQRCLHQWSDVRATAAIGFAGVSVFAEYRIFNFVRHDLPEIPRFQFGIRISGRV